MVAGNSLTRSACFFFCWGRGGGVGDAYGFFHNTTETLFGFIKLQVPRSCGICRRMMKLVEGQN